MTLGIVVTVVLVVLGYAFWRLVAEASEADIDADAFENLYVDADEPHAERRRSAMPGRKR